MCFRDKLEGAGRKGFPLNPPSFYLSSKEEHELVGARRQVEL